MAEPSARRTSTRSAPRTTQPDHDPAWTPSGAGTDDEAPVASRPLKSGPQAAPRYQQLAADLRTRIESGELAPGARLPTEQVMRHMYGVSLATIRQAVQILVNDGLLAKYHGHPTRVVGRQQVSRPVFEFRSPPPQSGSGYAHWTNDWQQLDTSAQEMGSAARYGDDLGIGRLDDVFILRRHLEHSTGRRAIHRTVVPTGTVFTVPALEEQPFRTPGELYQILTATGQHLDWHASVSVLRPTIDEADALNIPDGQSMLVHLRITLADGQPVALEETRLSGDQARISLD